MERGRDEGIGNRGEWRWSGNGSLGDSATQQGLLYVACWSKGKRKIGMLWKDTMVLKVSAHITSIHLCWSKQVRYSHLVSMKEKV